MTKRGNIMRTGNILYQSGDLMILRILRYLASCNLPQKQYKIMYTMMTNKEQITRYLNKCIDAGLIEFKFNRSIFDGNHLYTITDKGKQVLKLLEKQAELLGVKID